MRNVSWVNKGLVVAGLVLGLAGPAQAITMADSRLGGLAYYDSHLDITWAANANINGADTWANQVAWASGLMQFPLPIADRHGSLWATHFPEQRPGSHVLAAQQGVRKIFAIEGSLLRPAAFRRITINSRIDADDT